jgi:transcription initiation factor TFIIIB Brf1 subunit/transcription initiation factor TFIIB
MAANGSSSSSVATKPGAHKRDDSVNSRIIRKRETDRLAQRANRERTKQKIIKLEEEVERLKSNNQSAAMLDLMRLVEEQRKENEALVNSLEKIRGIVNEGGITGRGCGRAIGRGMYYLS